MEGEFNHAIRSPIMDTTFILTHKKKEKSRSDPSKSRSGRRKSC